MTDVIDAPPDDTGNAADPGEAPATDAAPLLDGDTVFTVHLRWFVAMCSAAAGLWHIVYAFPHLDHHVVLGQTFMAVGILQIAWAAWVVRAPSRALLLGGGVAAVVSTLVWVFAHSTGISWYPGLESAEIIGWGDTVTKWFELFLALGVVALLLPKTPATAIYKEAVLLGGGGDFEADAGALGCRCGVEVVGVGPEGGLGCRQRPAGALDVDVGGQLGHVGQHDHAAAADLHEPTVARERHLAVGRLQPHRPDRQRAQERGVPLEERDVAAAQRAADHHVGLALVEHLLGRHQLHRERHRRPSSPGVASPWRAPTRRHRR